MRIIHLTDPHLSSLADVAPSSLRGKRLLGYQSWYRKRRHQYQRQALDAIAASVQADAADLIIVTGDLVHIGLASEFVQAREWLETLGPASQVRVIPGNHDCYHRDSWPLARSAYAEYLAQTPGAAAELDSDPQAGFPCLERLGDLALIAATSAHPAPWWAAIGTLGTRQREEIAQALHATTGSFTIFALHHPPLPNSCHRRKALTDAKDLEKILRQGRPQITLHGHVHRNSTVETSYGRIYCTASAASVRKNAPASYRLIDIAPQDSGWQVNMTLKCLGPRGVVAESRETFTQPA